MTDTKFHVDQIYKEKCIFENFNMKTHKALIKMLKVRAYMELQLVHLVLHL